MRIKLLLVLFAFLFFASFAFSANWYVSPSGNNTTGNSWGTAWSEINQIKWASVAAGDTIWVDGGSSSISYSGKLDTGTAGTSSARITLKKSEEAGHNGIVYWHGELWIDQPYFTIDGGNYNSFIISDITTRPLDGFVVRSTADYFELRNIQIKGSMSTYGGNFIMANDRGNGNGPMHWLIKGCKFDGMNSDGEDHIKYQQDGGTLTIEDSIFTGIAQYEGIICGAALRHCDILQTGSTGLNLIVRRSKFIGNNDVFMLNTGGPALGNINISYSVFANDAYVLNTTYGAQSVTLQNNLFYHVSDITYASNAPTMNVKNNIYSGGTSIYDYSPHSPSGAPASYSLWDLTTGTRLDEEKADNTNQFDKDPKFVNKGTDFHLQSTSSAINKGANLGYTLDIEENPISGTPDIGPYEFQAVPSNVFYIRAGSSCTSNCGSNWTNAFPSLSAANSAGAGGKLTRGATYYIASGTYGGLSFDTPVSGTQIITLKKAVNSGDHGFASDWQSSYANGPALFTDTFSFNTNYWVFDGQVGGGPNSWTSGHGFKIQVDVDVAGFLTASNISNISILHTEITQTGNTISAPPAGGTRNAFYNNTIANNMVFSYLYFHHLKGLPLFMRGGSNGLIEYSYFSDPCGVSLYAVDQHCEHLVTHNYKNMTVRYSIFKDSRSTGVLVNNNETAENWEVYGNVFYNIEGGIPMSVAADPADHSLNFKIFNNSFINGGELKLTMDNSNHLIYNNVFYNGDMFPFAATHNYNYRSNPTSLRCDMDLASNENGTKNYPSDCDAISTTANPFTSGLSSDNYALNAPISGWPGISVCFLSGVTCDSTHTFNIDMFGNVRGQDGVWDRGAIEFTGASPPGDTTPPTTTASPVGGSYAGAQSVSLSRNESGTTYYCLGSGCTPATAYSSPVVVSSSNTLRFYSVDSAGNTESVKQQVYTITAPDTQAPSVPIGLSAMAVSSSQVNLSWTASTDNVAVTGYKVFRSLTQAGTYIQVGSSSTNSKSDSNGLSASTTYWFKVSAFDASGNNSALSGAVSATTSAGPAPGAGLVLALGFNEGSGTTTADASGQNNNGTLSGATWSTSGKFGNALNFNGSSYSVVVADSSSLDLTSGMTLEAWVYTSTATGWQTIVMKELDAIYYLYASSSIDGYPANTPSVGSNIGGYKELAGSTPILANAWVHVTGTYDGTTQRLYVNGAQIASRSQTGSLQNTSNPLRIGGNTQWGEWFSGRIDEVRVYNRALTAAEIQTDMATAIGGISPPSDTTAPSVPSGLSASVVSSSQINLSWTASTDNVGVTGYKVFRSLTQAGTYIQVGSSTTNSKSDSNGLSASTTYWYKVSAYDAAGNNSAQSSAVIATTQAPPITCFDLTNDSKVDVFDLVFVALRIGNTAGDPADVKDNDGVNISDLQEVAAHFGQAC